MENRSHALVAGFFVLLLGAATVVALWWLGQNHTLTNSYMLETRGNVTGLNVQAQVRYRGIRAGKVESIEPDPDNPQVIQVLISLDDRFKLTTTATAQLAYQGVTGLAYVLIEDNPTAKGAEPLPVDDDNPAKIAIKQGLFDSLGEKAGDIMSQVSTLATRLNRLLDEKNTSNLNKTLENMAIASDGMRELPLVIASLRETLSPTNINRIQQILVHIEKTSGEAAPLAVEMRELVRSMTALARKTEDLAGVTGEELNGRTLPRASVMLRDWTSNAHQFSRLLDSVESNPQMLLFGREAGPPGPGEAGFVNPTTGK